MAWVRRLGPVALVVVTVAVAVVGVGAALAVATYGPAAEVSSAHVRRHPAAGVVVPVPSGWRDRAKDDAAVVLELEQPALGGLIATRGLWVSRWSADDPEAVVGAWRALADARPSVVDGRDAVHRVDRLGPTITDRLPAFAALRRSQHRLVAFDHVYEVGFWGPATTVGDEVERAVLAAIRFHEPPLQRVSGGGWAVDVPGRWDRGRPGGCTTAEACAFAPPGGGRPPAAWVYVFDWPGSSLEAAAEGLVTALRDGGARDVQTAPADAAGRPAVRVRFGHPEDDGSVSSIEELLVADPAGDGFAVVALGWRTDAGRAQLDSVIRSLRPYHPRHDDP